MKYIKFRAWDKEKKIFVPQGEIIFSDYGDTRITVNPNCQEYIGDICHNYYDDGRFEITQYTGLLDKHGVEVYIGDILATSNNNPEYDIWSKEDYGFTVIEEDKHQLGFSYSNWHIDYDGDSSIFNNKFVEVIGNIYEHSYLLDNNYQNFYM